MIGQTLFDIITGFFKIILSEDNKESSPVGETSEKLTSLNDEKSHETKLSLG
ncbi:hypothetical protein COBT_000473, partial [Conglomerata obtusa]